MVAVCQFIPRPCSVAAVEVVRTGSKAKLWADSVLAINPAIHVLHLNHHATHVVLARSELVFIVAKPSTQIQTTPAIHPTCIDVKILFIQLVIILIPDKIVTGTNRHIISRKASTKIQLQAGRNDISDIAFLIVLVAKDV